MRRLALPLLPLLLLVATLSAPAHAEPDCTCKGIRLYGKVKLVTSFPDLKIKPVTAFPDIRVQQVSAFPDRCGKWQFVDAFPDFTVQFVDSFPDLKVQFVDTFPGKP